MMKKSAALWPAIFLWAAVSAAYPQSLSELADKEKARRQEIKDESKVITNAEAAKYSAGPVTTTSLPPAPADKTEPESAKNASDTQAASGPVDPNEPVDFEGRPESFWRKAMADARQKVKDLENEQNVLTLKQADLQFQFFREDDGYKREGVQRDIQKTYYEQDLNKENLTKAKEALADLEKEARKSGALPGWIESRTP